MTWLSNEALAGFRQSLEQPDLTGTPYELHEELGRGGMGIVFRAFDSELLRDVALKVVRFLDTDGSVGKRIRTEAEILARLEHPGIVPIYHIGVLPDARVFYTMRLVQGVRLDSYLRRGDSLQEMLRVLLKVCETVAFAHARGVIHRDLKPENIMVGSFGEVFVMDWGVARVDGHAESAGTVVGTSTYMAPEQARGEALVDARADVYSLGCVLRFLARDDAPAALRSVIRRATEEDQAQRYQTVSLLAQDIARYLDGLSPEAHRENVWERTKRLMARHRVVLSLLAAYLLMRILVFFFFRS